MEDRKYSVNDSDFPESLSVTLQMGMIAVDMKYIPETSCSNKLHNGENMFGCSRCNYVIDVII